VEYDCKTLEDKWQIDYEIFEENEILRVSIDDSIEVKGDDPSFPTLYQFETKIDEIDLTKRGYVLNQVVILREPERFRTEDGKEYTRTLIGDYTGYMTLIEEGANFLDKLHKNDSINVINALSYSNLLLLSPYGSIEKIETIEPDISGWLLERHKITPPNKIAIIEQEQTKGGIKVRLHKLHMLKDYTRLFATIENTNENNEVMLIEYDLNAIQRKKQFRHSYKTDSNYREVKSRIPPGVEEKGVLLFEPLDSIKDDVKFLIPFSNQILFTFDVKLS
jgi:hypothetical protein